MDGRTRTSSGPPSPVSPLSEHGDDTSRHKPASTENGSRPSLAEVVLVEKKTSQNPTPIPTRPSRWSRLVADSWAIELLAGAVSFAAIASIIGVLWGYDQKPVPALWKGITLNAVISFLATISRTAIMLCIGTVLSQGKWLWFLKKERSLMDLQDIEDASRGPLGSAFMLFKLRGGAVPYLAAFLTVATLGFDAFVQQLLTTEVRIVPVPANGISINSTTAMTLDIYAAMDYPETAAQFTAAMLANVQQEEQPMDGMAAAVSVAERRVRRKRSESTTTTTQRLASPLRADCPSGNCIWDPYYALDICSQCRTTTNEVAIKNLSPNSSDLTAMVSAARSGQVAGADVMRSSFTWEIVPKFGHTWRVPSNLSAFVNTRDLDGSAQALEVHASIVEKVVWPLNFAGADALLLDTSGWTRQGFAGIDEPVAAIGFAEFTITDDGVPALNHSQECALTYCVREYNPAVVQGNLILNVLSTHYGRVSKDDPDTSSGLSWSAEVNGTNFTADSFLAYGVGIGTLTNYLLGNSTHSYGGQCEANNDTWSCSIPVTSNSGTLEAYSTEAWQGIDFTSDFTAVLDDANTLTSQIVQRYGNVAVAGDNAVTKTFVVVRWPWITLPAAIVLFGVVILALTLWETSRMRAPSWKASLLPLLYRYVHVDGGGSGSSDVEGSNGQVDDGGGSGSSDVEGSNGQVDDGGGSSSSVEGSPGHVGTRPPSEPDSWFAGSNLVSEFQVEAEATATRLSRDRSKLHMWQLQSLDIVQKDRKGWWPRRKWW